MSAALLTAALLLTGCGGGDDSSADAPDNQQNAAEANADPDAAQDMKQDMKQDMNMGDPDAVPADQISGAELQQGEFALLDTRPPGMDGVEGRAWLAQHDQGTTVTLQMSGLVPEVDYISHLHVNACADGGGGPHFKFDPNGSDMPPNEVHLAFTSDAEGNGRMTVNNDRKTEDGVASVVVHRQDALANRIACVDF